jgi:hypothetical protein
MFFIAGWSADVSELGHWRGFKGMIRTQSYPKIPSDLCFCLWLC